MKIFIVYYIIIVSVVVPLFWSFEGLSEFVLFQYLDEFLGVLSILYIAFFKSHLSNNENKIVLLSILLICVGFVGSFVYQYQLSLFPLVVDAFQCLKCFLVFILGNHYIMAMSTNEKKSIILTVNKVLIPFLIIAFIFASLNIFVDIGMHTAIRNGFRTFQFLYKKSGVFSDMFFFFLIFLTMGFQLSNKKKLYLIMIIIALFIWVLTWRTRSLVYVPMYIMMFYWTIMKKRKFKISISVIASIIFIALIIGSKKIESTYGEEDAGPRAILLVYGIKTMLNHAPIGAGLSTYGTDMASKYYSPLYHQYGFDYLWGLSPEYSVYTHDNYWPAIFGEFGIIGAIIVVFMIFYTGKEILYQYKKSIVGSMLSIFIFITIVLNSTATPSLFFSQTAFLFMLIPLTNLKRRRKNVSIFERKLLLLINKYNYRIVSKDKNQ